MTQKLELEGINLDIAIATEKSAVSTINPEFLIAAGISDEIQLVSEPILTKDFASVELAQNIRISGEFGRVAFSELMAGKTDESLKIPSMAIRYTKTLSHLGYKAFALNYRGFRSFPSDQDGARKYIIENFFPNASWQTIGKSPARASVNLVFEMSRSPVYMNITEATVRKEDESTMPIVMFSGSFSYVLDGESAAEKLAYMHECIGNWQSDFAEFTDIINNHFLVQPVVESYQQLPQVETEEIPNIFAMTAAV
jgi:hypothetical protein